MTEELHLDLARFVQGAPPYGPWLRALVCAFRGSLKSSVATTGFLTWKGLNQVNWAAKLIEQSADNAYRNHFQVIDNLFRHSGYRSDYLYWLYEDRIPENFAGWNAYQIVFNRTDPTAPPAITYGGLESRYEGYHGDAILADDPEGADAEKSDAPNADSWRLVSQRAIPLLKDPSKGQILVIGTSHGNDPVVWKIREREEGFQRKNPGKRVWAIWWKEAVDSEGNSRWPERFTPTTIEMLKLDEELWDRQYMLRKESAKTTIFDLDRIRERMYRWEVPRHLISYERDVVNTHECDEEGFFQVHTERKTVSPWALRRFLHADPKHRERIASKGYAVSEAAMAVCGVNHDGHVMTLDTWAEDCSLEEFGRQLYLWYRKWNPVKVTMEAIGAQYWFWDYAKQLERHEYREIWSMPQGPKGHVYRMPSLSSRLEEAEKKNAKKEEWIISQLESYFNHGTLHLGPHQDHLMQQIRSFPNPTALRDLLDCLSQGPSVWQAPASPEALNAMRVRRALERIQNPPDEITGYATPWIGSHIPSSGPLGLIN